MKFIVEYDLIPTEHNGLQFPLTRRIILGSAGMHTILQTVDQELHLGRDCIAVRVYEVDDRTVKGA